MAFTWSGTSENVGDCGANKVCDVEDFSRIRPRVFGRRARKAELALIPFLCFDEWGEARYCVASQTPSHEAPRQRANHRKAASIILYRLLIGVWAALCLARPQLTSAEVSSELDCLGSQVGRERPEWTKPRQSLRCVMVSLPRCYERVRSGAACLVAKSQAFILQRLKNHSFVAPSRGRGEDRPWCNCEALA